MFDAIRRFVFDKGTGEVHYVKDQIGVPLDKPVSVGKPLKEDDLRKRTSEYRVDGVAFRDDKELIGFVQRLHMLRTEAGFNPNKVKGI